MTKRQITDDLDAMMGILPEDVAKAVLAFIQDLK